MDLSRYAVRPFRDGDYEARSRIGNQLEPEFPTTAEELRQWDRMYLAPQLVKLDFIVEERASGRGVAYASLHHMPSMFNPRRFWAEVQVEPGHQHQGIGLALYKQLEGLALGHQAELLWAGARADDERGVRFFERAGFSVHRRTWMSRLALDTVRPDALRPGPGIRAPEVTFTTLVEEGADRRDVQERIHRLDTEASRDSPRMGRMTEISFEQYAELAFRGPRYFPEAVFLARVDHDYVAMTTFERLPAEPDTVLVGFTGTLPAYRGRGLASELKRRAVEFARARGYRYMRTFNDSENPRIWAINEKLGFAVQLVWLTGEKRFGPTPGDAPT